MYQYSRNETIAAVNATPCQPNSFLNSIILSNISSLSINCYTTSIPYISAVVKPPLYTFLEKTQKNPKSAGHFSCPSPDFPPPPIRLDWLLQPSKQATCDKGNNTEYSSTKLLFTNYHSYLPNSLAKILLRLVFSLPSRCFWFSMRCISLATCIAWHLLILIRIPPLSQDGIRHRVAYRIRQYQTTTN